MGTTVNRSVTENIITFDKSLLISGELSLSALGLMLIMLHGDMDLAYEDEDYQKAFKELYKKGFLDIKVR